MFALTKLKWSFFKDFSSNLQPRKRNFPDRFSSSTTQLKKNKIPGWRHTEKEFLIKHQGQQ